MIAIRPDTLAWDALVLIAAYPGEHTVDSLVRELRLVQAPPKPVLVPLAGPVRGANMAAWRARVATWNTEVAAWRSAVDELRAIQRAKVARTLGRLVEAGLLEKLGPPTLSPEFRTTLVEYGAPAALRRFHPAWPGKVNNHGEALHLRLIARAQSGNCSTRAVLGSKTPSGTALRAYSELVRWGVLIAPQQRTATAAGVALVSAPALRVVA